MQVFFWGWKLIDWMRRKAYRVNNKAFETIVFVVLLSGILAFAFNVLMVAATDTIYVRADGSFYPPTALIPNVGNVSYTFTSSINNSIVVERDNVLIDGSLISLNKDSSVQRCIRNKGEDDVS